MDPKAVLADPRVCPSVALAALGKLLGGDALDWEPDTIRLELSRRKVEPTDALMAKLMGAQTVADNFVWAHEHDVLFAFALACEGVPAYDGSFLHPTPEQLVWAVNEAQVIVGKQLSEDEGTDPDAVDPAIAAVLHEDGWVLAPHPLGFAQHALDWFNRGSETFTKEVRSAWEGFEEMTLDGLRRKISEMPEDALGVQLRRLADAKAYVAEREQERAKQVAALAL